MPNIQNVNYGVKMTYSVQDMTFEFSPVPFIQSSRTIDLSGKTETGFTTNITVTGTLVAQRHLENEGVADSGLVDKIVLGEIGLTPLDKLKRAMETVLSIPGGEFRIYCNCEQGEDCVGNREYFKFYPSWIGELQFQQSPDNWVTTIPYTFQMRIDRTDIFKNGEPLYLEQIEENWSVEAVDEKIFPDIDDSIFETNRDGIRILRLTHTLSATGKQVYSEQDGLPRAEEELLYNWRNTQAGDLREQEPESFSPVNNSRGPLKTPYYYAKEWVDWKLKHTEMDLVGGSALSGHTDRENFFFLDGDDVFKMTGPMKVFNHTRQKGGNEITGQYNVTESWLIIVGGPHDIGATDEYTLDYNVSHDNAIEKVSINGTIQGYQEGDITERMEELSKIYQAEKLLEQLLGKGASILYQRCQFWYEKISELDPAGCRRPLNPIPTSKRIGRNPVDGVITYTFEFDNRCENVFPDALSESITFSMNYPTDHISEVFIPGRQRGPIVFSANTYTNPTCTVNVELVMRKCPNPCELNFAGPRKLVFEKVIEPLFGYLKSMGGDIIKSRTDTDNWNMKENRYSANFTFLFAPCSSEKYVISATRIMREGIENVTEPPSVFPVD